MPVVNEIAAILDQEDEMMGDDWRRLWKELIDRPLDETTVKAMKGHPTKFMLTLWCRTKKSTEATVERLIAALNAIYRNDVAEMVEKYVEVRTGNASMHGIPIVSLRTCLS